MKHTHSNENKSRLLDLFSLRTFIFFFVLGVVSGFSFACSDDDSKTDTPNPDPSPDPSGVVILTPDDVPDYEKYYKPKEFASMDMLRSDSKWSFVRSKQSDHFVVFWEAKFGANPNADSIPQNLRVDIDDLLKKSEEFYKKNVEVLKFAELGNGKSNLDKYKMQIYLLYQEEWLATGSGYDDVIGALWVNPSTCKPVGSTIAHEIGHSFQYQVYADLLATGTIQNDFTRGFRYGFGGNGGNTFWEQTAQWQSFQSYPTEAFESYNFGEYMDNCHRHVNNEFQRYASYFIHYYWADKHGIDFIGKLWREAKSPEDPMMAYMRINGLSVEQFNAEIYDASTRFVTWDIEAIRSTGVNYIGKQNYGFFKNDEGYYQVAYSKCPGSTGYNVIPLNVPTAGTVITTDFEGLQTGVALVSNDPGQALKNDKNVTVSKYNTSSSGRAGWRYGYVALLNDGTRVYGDMNSKINTTVSFTVPQNCNKLWFVVVGAPNTYVAHAWDEDETNDDQWPYAVKFSNTDILGNFSFNGDEVPSDTEIVYNLDIVASTTEYTGCSVTVTENQLQTLAKSFVLQPSEIKSAIGKDISFYAVESGNKLNGENTANGYGHWFDANGNVCKWGDQSMVFSEFSDSNFTFTIGQYPGHCKAGDKYIIKQALVYSYASGKSVQATFSFNLNFK